MKKTLVLIAILSFAKTSFCQRELAEEYKAKSRHFRTGGIILVSVGGAMALTGTALILGDQRATNITTMTSLVQEHKQG